MRQSSVAGHFVELAVNAALNNDAAAPRVSAPHRAARGIEKLAARI